MTTYPTGADEWVWLYNDSDQLHFKCEKVTYDKVNTGVTDIHYPGRGHFGFTLQQEIYTVKIKNATFYNYADYNNFKKGIKAMEDSTSDVNLQVEIDSSNNKELWDGVNDIMPVQIKQVNGYEKIYGGDTTIYKVAMITLIQIGALSAT